MHDDDPQGIAHHAEYKVPGGKLLVVDLRTQGNVLADVRLSGDFFMEPPEALDIINGALNGLPQDADSAQLEQAVQSAIAGDVQMFGITVEGIVTVIQRALA